MPSVKEGNVRKLCKKVSALVVLLSTSAVMAQGPDVPATPGDPGGVQGFIMTLLDNVRAFVEGLVGSLPI